MRAGHAPLRQGSLLCRRSVCGRHAHDGQRQAVRAAAGREPPALRGRGSEVGARSPHYENAVLTHTEGELAVNMGTHGVGGGVPRPDAESHTEPFSPRRAVAPLGSSVREEPDDTTAWPQCAGRQRRAPAGPDRSSPSPGARTLRGLQFLVRLSHRPFS